MPNVKWWFLQLPITLQIQKSLSIFWKENKRCPIFISLKVKILMKMMLREFGLIKGLQMAVI